MDPKTLTGITLEPGPGGVWTLKIPQMAEVPAKTETVEAEQVQALAGVADFEINGIPVGAALLGGTLAVGLTELISGFIPEQGLPGGVSAKLVAQAVAAWAAIQWGPNLIGKEAFTIAAAFIAFDATRTFIPLDENIKKIVRQVTARTGGTTDTVAAAQGNATIDTAPADQGQGGLPALAAGRLALAGL